MKDPPSSTRERKTSKSRARAKTTEQMVEELRRHAEARAPSATAVHRRTFCRWFSAMHRVDPGVVLFGMLERRPGQFYVAIDSAPDGTDWQVAVCDNPFVWNSDCNQTAETVRILRGFHRFETRAAAERFRAMIQAKIKTE